MRVECVGNSGCQVVLARRRAHSRNIKIGVLRVAARFRKDLLNALLGARVVNESRLQIGEQCCILLHRHLVLCELGIFPFESVLDHLSSEGDQFFCPRRSGVDEQLSAVQQIAPLIVTDCGIKKNGVHEVAPREGGGELLAVRPDRRCDGQRPGNRQLTRPYLMARKTP